MAELIEQSRACWRSRRVTTSWQNIEIVGGGFISGLVAHPQQPGLRYARTDIGGAYRWDEPSARWVPITDWIGQDDWRLCGIESVATDPSDPRWVYLAAGTYNRRELGPAALLRSNDQGRSWSVLPMPCLMGANEAGRGSGERLAVDPHRGGLLWFGSRDSGLLRSLDRGESWSPVESFPRIETALSNPTPGRWNYLTQAVGIVFVMVDPSSGSAERGSRCIYAGVSTRDGGLYRSLDGGQSWQLVPRQPLGLRPIRAALANNGVLYVTYGSEPGPNTMRDGAVYRFDPRREAWDCITPLVPEPEAGQAFGYAGVAVDAAHPDTLMVTTACRGHSPGTGGDELFRSVDGGQSWKAIGQAGHRDARHAPWLKFGRDEAHVGHWMYALLIDPHDCDRAFYATGQTIWETRNLTATDRGARSAWVVGAGGIEETVPLAIASPPAGAEVIVGTGDISGFVVTSVSDSSQHRQLLSPTFKNTTGIDYAEARPELVVRVGSRGWDRARDRDVGAYSTDGGQSWRAFSASVPEAQKGHVAVSADGQSWVWQPRGARAHYTRDRAKSWQPCAGLPEGRLQLLSDRVDPRLFYAVGRGPWGPPWGRAAAERESQGLFVSRDGGATFSRLPVELPRAPSGDARAVVGHTAELWLPLGGLVYLYRASDGTLTQFSGLTAVTHLGLGAPDPALGEEGYPALYAVGKLDGVQGFYRSTDRAQSFVRINDEAHQYGRIRVIAGDPKRFGRVYVGTEGRGVVYGDEDGR